MQLVLPHQMLQSVLLFGVMEISYSWMTHSLQYLLGWMYAWLSLRVRRVKSLSPAVLVLRSQMDFAECLFPLLLHSDQHA